MLKKTLIVALRNLKRHKVFSAINILGLAGSMAVFIMISLYVRLISGTDKFHENATRIFRIERPQIHNMAAPVGPFLKNQYPEVESFIRISNSPLKGGFMKVDTKNIKVENVWLADSSFFSSFTFPLVSGLPSNVLSNPDMIVLSETTAKRLFGNENPVGKSVVYENKFPLQVSGVMKDFPVNSSIQADAIVPFDFHKTIYNNPSALDNFYQWNYHTYLLLKPNVNTETFTAKMNVDLLALIKRNIDIPENEKIDFILTPLPNIYFNTYKNNDRLLHGKRSNITIALGVSLIILLLAIINFTNLSTAQATYRTKEIGIKKTLGATRLSIVKQHLFESILTAYISILIAVLIVEQLLHVMTTLVNVKLHFHILDTYNLSVIILGPLLLGILAGSYPAFYVSKFSPKTILSGSETGGEKGGVFRKFLTITQFAAATILIIFTLHVNRQVNYLNNRDLGIDKENKLVLETSPEMLTHTESFMNDLRTNPNIISATLHASPIGTITEGWSMMANGQDVSFKVQLADSNYCKTLGLNILEGKTFKNHQSTDSVFEVLINKQAVEVYKFDEPVGMEMDFVNNMKLRIVGVVSDYHFESLHKPIEPLMIVNRTRPHLITVNYIPNKTKETISFVEKLWENYSPNSPLTYRILKDDLKELYTEEARLKSLFQGFTFISIFIACIGLFGLSAFSISKRTREIGIRKVLGSSSAGVTRFIVWQFLRMILVSTIIAFPVSWWIVSRWLQNFITPIGQSIGIFIFSGALVCIIALLTIIYHSIKAANTNPASILKYE